MKDINKSIQQDKIDCDRERAYLKAHVNALQVQDACNLSGVVGQLSRDTKAIWAEARFRGEGSDWVNQHSIVRVYMSKLFDLAGMYADGITMESFEACEKAALRLKDIEAAESAQPKLWAPGIE